MNGSVNRWVRREVREQLRANPMARRARYSWAHRVVRGFFSIGTFARFVALYLTINILLVTAEALLPIFLPQWLSGVASGLPPPTTDTKSLILNVSSYLIGAQVGMLGVISLALALVTLIAQREGSSTDVQVYYHESFAIELVASSVALLAVLCVQLLWPLQFILHRAGLGTDLMVFKLALLSLHMGWLLINLGAVAYFITTTFRFVQRRARERLRERYTTNIVLPRDLRQRLRAQLYALGNDLLDHGDSNDKGLPSVAFGLDYERPNEVEIESQFARPFALDDVRMTWVRWVLKRWSARCCKAGEPAPGIPGLSRQGPLLWFTPHIDQPLRGTVGWCRRRGGVRLTGLEKIVLRHAFRFRRIDDEI